MNVIIPVTLFAVTYETGSGRPYSGFERLVLRAIADGRNDLSSLDVEFAVHRRVLIEALVTLIHAGWIALGSAEADLVLTPSGTEAAQSLSMPTTLVIRRPAPATIIMEQVTGSVVHSSQVRYTTYGKLQGIWHDAIRLPALVHDSTLDVGQIQHLLPCPRDEWVRWINPAISVRSSGAHYLVAEVDAGSGHVYNLPALFVDALEPTLHERLGERVSALRPEVEADDAVTVRPAQWQTPISASDVIVGTDEHASRLDRALATATSRVLVTSAFVTAEVIDTLAPHIEAASRRGVDVDLLWGYGKGTTHRSAVTRLEALSRSLTNGGSQGRLRFNREPSASHMKVLIWDAPTGWRAIVGSHNWLSAYRLIPLVDVSVQLSSPDVIATIVRHVGSLWAATPGEGLSAVPGSWQAVAAEIGALSAAEDRRHEEPTETGGSSVEVSLIYGRSHEIELRHALRDSRDRLLVTSHHVSRTGIDRLAWAVSAPRGAPFIGEVVIGEVLDDTTLEEVRAASSAAGCRLLNRRVHAKVLVSDNSVVIGSYNFLAADPLGFGSRARELSLKIRDHELTSMVARRLLEGLVDGGE